MRKSIVNKILILAVMCGLAFSTQAQEYNSTEVKEVIEKMLKAHGGLDNWKKTPSFSYDLAMYMPSIPLQEGWNEYDQWRLDKFQFDVNTGKGIVEIPWQNAQIGFDGREIWNKGYIQEKMRLSAGFRLYYHFGLINQPFLTQLPGVKIGELKKGTIPNDDTEYLSVRLTYAPGNGNTHNGFYQLFIDPVTYLLKAVLGNVRVPLLPGNVLVALLGDNYELNSGRFEIYRVFKGRQTVDGITIPSQYTTLSSSGEVMGMHIVINPSFKEKLKQKKVALR